MFNNISLQYPTWFILFCILIGIFYAGLMYFKDRKFEESPNWTKPLMALLRFLSITILSFLLLSPVIKVVSQDVKDPIIIIAEDKSKSIANINKQELETYSANMNQLVNSLSEQYEVVRLNFGSDVVPAKSDSFVYDVTNLSNAVNYIHDGYVDQNIGAIVISSDGIYNEGKNPIYEKFDFKAPLYTIALGDTSLRKDLSVSNVLHNKISYLGDKANLQVDLKGVNCVGLSTKVKLFQFIGGKKKLLQENSIKFNNKLDYKTSEFLIEANNVGINKYQVVIGQTSGEISYVNNTRDVYIEVIDGKQSILILADGPHPDIGALKNIINTNKNYVATSAFASNLPRNLAQFDLVVLHNLPSSTNDISSVIDMINSNKIPRLFIAGTNINQSKFNTVQSIVKISGNANSNEDIQPDLKSNFNLFTLSDGLVRQLKRYPPLRSQFGTYSLQSSSSSLLNQKIKKIGTQYPLLSFQDLGGIKSAVFTGEGIWRWRMFDYQEQSNYEPISELINKTIQYLTVKVDKRKFRVSLAKNVFNENEDLIFDAQLYNDSYELVNQPDVLLSVKDDSGKEYKFSFSKSNNYYTLNAGQLPEGVYRYTATVNYNGVAMSSKGNFRIRRIELEQYELTANHRLLFALSEKYNGQMFEASQIGSLSNSILTSEKIKPSIFNSTKTSNLLGMKWIFWVVLFLLGLEWFMRRFYGSY